MAIKVVNSNIGYGEPDIKPGQAVYLGLRSESLSVVPGTIDASLGFSNIIFHQELPELDTELTDAEATVTLETPERVRPYSSTNTNSITAGNLVMTKNGATDFDFSIYEVAFNTRAGNSPLAYFKVKLDSWTASTRDWWNSSDISPVYLGLEHGPLNTGCFVTLRANTVGGTIAVGGPLQSPGGTRPAEVSYDLDWRLAAVGEYLQVWIYFNTASAQVEVWTQLPSETAPVIQTPIAFGALGTFPTDQSNFRNGISTTGRVFFGNSGGVGEDVELSDWAVYPNFVRAIVQGVAATEHVLNILPDGPVSYRVDSKALPSATLPTRWYTLGTEPTSELHYQAGLRETPVYLTSEGTGLSAFKRDEPRLEQRIEGFSIEAFMSGESVVKDGSSLVTGLMVDDGSKVYRVVMLDDSNTKTYGINKDDSLYTYLDDGYWTPATAVDFSALKLVRLTVDRIRSTVDLYVDEELVLSKALSETFPDTVHSKGVVAFGQVIDGSAKSKMHTAFLNYLSRYVAWEGTVDGLVPSDASLPALSQFTLVASGTGDSVMSSDGLTLTKSELNTVGSSRYYTRSTDFTETTGVQVDFEVRVAHYTDYLGQQNPASVEVGAGIQILNGSTKLHFGFFDCGIHGKKIGILPSGGDTVDILTQTATGRLMSASYDWSKTTRYRIVAKPYDSIKVWADSVVTAPLIDIPWPFDLPTDVTASSIRFGHFDELSTSVTEWSYVRWGSSNGFDVAVEQSFPFGYERHLFGGKVLLRGNFDES